MCRMSNVFYARVDGWILRLLKTQEGAMNVTPGWPMQMYHDCQLKENDNRFIGFEGDTLNYYALLEAVMKTFHDYDFKDSYPVDEVLLINAAQFKFNSKPLTIEFKTRIHQGSAPDAHKYRVAMFINDELGRYGATWCTERYYLKDEAKKII